MVRLFDSDLQRTSSYRSASGVMNGRRIGRGRGILVVVVVVGVVLWGVIAGSGASAGHKRGVTTASGRPNIVFVLTDDLAWNLVTSRFMPHVMQLERQGETFRDYIVADSLCCPSRTSIFTGLFPHDSGVFTNQGAHGGYYAFTHHKPNLETRTFAVATQQAGYLNSMMGKYLNGYGEPTMTTHVPPGWSDWHVGGNAYPEFNYDLNENGTVVHYGAGPPPGRECGQLPDRRARLPGDGVHRSGGQRAQAVRDGGRHVRAAQPVHAGAAQRNRLSWAPSTPRPVVQHE